MSRPTFADPKTDFIFKRIFGSEPHKNLLIKLLNALLELDERSRRAAEQQARAAEQQARAAEQGKLEAEQGKLEAELLNQDMAAEIEQLREQLRQRSRP